MLFQTTDYCDPHPHVLHLPDSSIINPPRTKTVCTLVHFHLTSSATAGMFSLEMLGGGIPELLKTILTISKVKLITPQEPAHYCHIITFKFKNKICNFHSPFHILSYEVNPASAPAQSSISFTLHSMSPAAHISLLCAFLLWLSFLSAIKLQLWICLWTSSNHQ